MEESSSEPGMVTGPPIRKKRKMSRLTRWLLWIGAVVLVLAVAAGVILFAVSLERAGLVPATLLLVLVSSLAEPGWRPRRAAILAVVVTALVYLLFVTVLQIPVAAVSL